MADNTVILESMAAGPPDETGQEIRFRVNGADGGHVDVACRLDMVETAIRFLVELARDAAGRRADHVRGSFSRAELVEAAPMPVSHATFVADPETKEIALALRMSGFDLAFALMPEHLSLLKKELERIVPAVVPPGGHHHDHDHHH